MDVLPLIEPLFTSPWFYPLTAGLAAGDVLFPIIPSEGTVIAAGVLAASTGTPNLLLVMAAAAAGAFVGDHLSYAIGRSFLGPKLLARSKRLRAAVGRVSRQLDKRGGTLIVAGRFIPGGRTAVTLACGSAGYPLRRFTKATALAAMAWALYSGAIGFLGGAAFTANPILGIAIGVGLSMTITGAVELVRHLVRRRTADAPLGHHCEPRPAQGTQRSRSAQALSAVPGGAEQS
ncbi:VTT domain-containing protein [Actinoplanes sp. NPDC051633]|uniref:DedA family protein n=1 Tax=Actinoplanes sp. NPDC051633 TaxID=3155670 RepID=UPI003444EF89